MMLKETIVTVARPFRDAYHYLRLSAPAKEEMRRDHREPLPPDPGITACIDASLEWLGRAQDLSATGDGGVARHFSLITGWAPSYPETTGYIIPTLLDAAERDGRNDLRARAHRMLDWLTSIQFDDGGFQGGPIGARPLVPVTFNTGQILLGLARAARDDERYRKPMQKAADWLVRTQSADGCWRSHATPFAAPGEKTYETHVAWGLLEAARVEPARGYADAALKNVRWALQMQRENGWLDKCCLTDASAPLTHTLGYALRGVIEGYLFSHDAGLLAAAEKTADGLLSAQRADGSLPGRLDASWRGTVPWNCLTGIAQSACCWLLLYGITHQPKYRDGAFAANAYVRRTVRVAGPEDMRGAVKGSFPIDGAYGRFEYLNWACKFFIDANVLEVSARGA